MFRLMIAAVWCFVIGAWLPYQQVLRNVAARERAQTPPLCPGVEPNDNYNTPWILASPSTWLDSQRHLDPERDAVDVYRLPSTSSVTQTLRLISQGPGSDPKFVLSYFSNDDPNTGTKYDVAEVDDIDYTRCKAGQFWMCNAIASFVWDGWQQLYATVTMLGAQPVGTICLYYRLEYESVLVTPTPTPTTTLTPTPTNTPTPTPIANSWVYLPMVLH